MTIHVLVIDSRPCQRAYAKDILLQSGAITCEAVDDIDTALERLKSACWDVLVCAFPAHDHRSALLIDAIASCERKPDLVLTTQGDPILLTNTMRLALARGVRVRGYAVDPLNPSVLLGLVTEQRTLAPFTPERAPHPQVPVEDVAAALARDEVQVTFLPQTACIAHDGETVAADTLLRWRHPEHGWLETRDMVRLVNGTEHACKLFHYSLSHIAKAMALWLRHDFHPAVSCSAPLCLLHLPESAERLRAALEKYDLQARDLTFGLDLPDLDPQGLQALAARLLPLRQQGVEFAINNYGVAGTTLANLIDLPVSEIRLAPDLICGIGFDPLVQRLVSGIVALAKTLDMRVVATSVQRESDVELLVTLGCDFVEGPVVGEARSAEALALWNRDRTARASGGTAAPAR